MTSKERKELMYERIKKHGEDLKKFFGLPESTDPVKLCKRLHRMEVEAGRHNTDHCNTNSIES